MEYLFSQLRLFVSSRKQPVVKSLDGVKFEFDFKEDLNIKRMHFGLYEPGVRYTMKKFLREGDTFIDVGANIGYISAIAAGLVGITGKVHSFEPVPKYFQKLQNLAEANRKFSIEINQVALGENKGAIKMYISKKDIGNNTMLADLLDKDRIEAEITVPVERLDNYIERKKLKNIKMLKIDVEGFEFPVLRGLESFFLESQTLPLIVCEICPSAGLMREYEMKELLDYMKSFSYLPFDIIAPNRRLSEDEIAREHTINVLFRPYVGI